MKSIVLSCAIILFVGLYAISAEYTVVNGCYVCYQNKNYVSFKGKDSSEKREEALNKFGCKVYAILTSCPLENFSEFVLIKYLD